MIDGMFARAFHHVECADHVRFEIGARIFEAVPHPRLRGEVDDYVGFELGADLFQRVDIFEHRFGRRKGVVLAQHGMAALLDPDIVIVGHPVEAVNPEAFGHEFARQMKPDEAGAPGDKDLSHDAPLIAWGPDLARHDPYPSASPCP